MFPTVIAQAQEAQAAGFDSVFVMCEDPRVRDNRLALLREVAGLSEGVVKFDELPGF